MKTPKHSRRCFSLLAVTLSACVVTLFVFSSSIKAKGKPGGGGGGNDGGDSTILNPAFVYEELDSGALFLSTSSGDSTIQLTRPPRKGKDTSAVWSPDGSRVAFLRKRDGDLIWSDLYTIRPDGSELTFIRPFDSADLPIPRDWAHLTWASDGSTVVYASQWLSHSIWAVNSTTGALQLVFEDESVTQISEPDLSPDMDLVTSGYQGTLAFRAFFEGNYFIWLLDVQIDESGNVTSGNLRKFSGSNVEEMPSWSPDGQYLAFANYARFDESWETDIVAFDLQSNFSWTVVTIYGPPTQPSWSPDGKHLCFSAFRETKSGSTIDIYRCSPWDLSAPLFNVTLTDSNREREIRPRWNPAWDNDTSP